MIDRYLAGTATPREAAFIRRWLEEKEPGQPALDEATRQAVKAALWEEIAAKTQTPPALRVRRGRQLLRYAAAVLTLCAGSAAYWLLRPAAVPKTATVVTALAGQHKKITLPDHSVVDLFPHSVLTIPAGYNRQERRLLLQGRGFFEVAAEPSRPFSVQTGRVRTQVLGTSFEMATANNHTQATVIVCTGKVQVQEAGHALANLTPGKRLQYNLQNRSMKIDTVNTRLPGEWRNNILSFEQASLQEVVSAMNDWYDAEIVIADKKWLKESVTIRFQGGTVHDAIRLLSQTLNFHYRETGQQIIIY